MENKNKFVKAYDEIMLNDELDLYETYLLCRYISKYEYFGSVSTSDSKDSKYMNVTRQTAGEKRKHLEELGYIKTVATKGKGVKVEIKDCVLEALGLKKDK